MKIHNDNDLIFNRYRVDGYIGEGGMQEVYRATDVSLHRTVALKTPKNDHGAKRFQRSAFLSAMVRHPSVSTTLDYFEEGNRAYLVEEYITGLDLKKVMTRDYLFLDPALAAHLATHLAKGLAACHAMDIWHRDLKPANIMVSDDLIFSVIKITDFGIAKMVEDEFKDDTEGDLATSITGSQTLLGAAPYMAPENMFTPKIADKRADVWSFGAILYALLIGTPPFGSNYPAIAVALHAGGKFAPPPTWTQNKTQFKDVFNGLWEIVQACLVVDPALRPTAEQLIVKLSGLCFSLYPRARGITKAQVLVGGRGSFVHSADGDAFYHLDSYYKDGGLIAGEHVAFSRHKGSPSDRAFPLVPLRAPTA